MPSLVAFLPPLPPTLAALRGAARGAARGAVCNGDAHTLRRTLGGGPSPALGLGRAPALTMDGRAGPVAPLFMAAGGGGSGGGGGRHNSRRNRRPSSTSRHAGAGKSSGTRSPYARAAEARRAVTNPQGGSSSNSPSVGAGTRADAVAAAATAIRRGRRVPSAAQAPDAPGAVDGTPRGRPRPAAVPGGGARGALSNVGALSPVIQWYPGHIAKAERSLRATLKLVDVVVEVRDCRIPLATAHPDVASWVGSKGRVLVMNRADSVPDVTRADWRRYYVEEAERQTAAAATATRGEGAAGRPPQGREGGSAAGAGSPSPPVGGGGRAALPPTVAPPRFINAKTGDGVRGVRAAALAAGAGVNARRAARGLLPRPVRVVVIGYPNVGKSALINRLVGRRAVRSANTPGVTRQLQWVRLADDLELLDMPGIIPAKLVSQATAVRLALCDDIGTAAYDNQVMAAALVTELCAVAARRPGYVDLAAMERRYKVPVADRTGEAYLHKAAERLYQGDLHRMSMRMLNDFRGGLLGPIGLEAPPSLDDDGEWGGAS